MHRRINAMTNLEMQFNLLCRALELPEPVREYQFLTDRRFRFDFCWVDKMLAAEVEGGTWSGGRHSREPGYSQDAYKYSRAALAGWKVIRITGDMLNDGRAEELILMAWQGKE